MHRRIHVLALFTAFALAACSPDGPVAPLKAPPSPRLAKSAGDQSGKYIVLMQGGLPRDFAQTVAGLGGTIRSTHAGAGFATVSGLTDAAASQLAATSGVLEVDPDAIVQLDQPVGLIQTDAAALSAPTTQSQANPATAILASWQWNMLLIDADKAWAAQKLGSPNVTVAILDTGMDYDNRDLNGLVDLSRSVSFMDTFVPGPDGVASSPSDDDITTTFFPTRNKISDYNGHGTNVAATVSSLAFAFAGVTSKTTLIGVKVLGAHGGGTFGDILNGVLWAADHGADVANMSLGGEFPRAHNGQLIRAIRQVFGYAAFKGMLIVVAAGNSAENLDRNGDTYVSFCDAPHVMCVSAVGPEKVDSDPDAQAFYTNFGRSSIDVAGPGGNESFATNPLSAWPWGPDSVSRVWSFCSRTLLKFTAAGVPSFAGCQSGGFVIGAIGTSQATPHVTGLAALLVADNGHARPNKIKRMIEDSGDPIRPRLGESRINVANALGLNKQKKYASHGGY